jgi:hypothetical protein
MRKSLFPDSTSEHERKTITEVIYQILKVLKVPYEIKSTGFVAEHLFLQARVMTLVGASQYVDMNWEERILAAIVLELRAFDAAARAKLITYGYNPLWQTEVCQLTTDGWLELAYKEQPNGR